MQAREYQFADVIYLCVGMKKTTKVNKMEAMTALLVITYKPYIEELEMLLEAYFVQIGGTLN